MLAAWQNDHAAARAFLDEGLALARELGEARTAATALTWLGVAAKGRGDSAAARPLYEEAIALGRAARCRPGARARPRQRGHGGVR